MQTLKEVAENFNLINMTMQIKTELELDKLEEEFDNFCFAEFMKLAFHTKFGANEAVALAYPVIRAVGERISNLSTENRNLRNELNEMNRIASIPEVAATPKRVRGFKIGDRVRFKYGVNKSLHYTIQDKQNANSFILTLNGATHNGLFYAHSSELELISLSEFTFDDLHDGDVFVTSAFGDILYTVTNKNKDYLCVDWPKRNFISKNPVSYNKEQVDRYFSSDQWKVIDTPQ